MQRKKEKKNKRKFKEKEILLGEKKKKTKLCEELIKHQQQISIIGSAECRQYILISKQMCIHARAHCLHMKIQLLLKIV